ncbi:histidine kinase [Opitutaceae bacterium TAV5]|nr:histidine kinase [Opitutaceae bacterium TAV5]
MSAAKKHSPLDRVLGQINKLDTASLATLAQRLARERELFESIFNILQEGVLVIHADGHIEYANAAAHRLVGVSGNALQGDLLWRFVPGLRPSLEPSLDGTAPVVTREFELTYPESRTVRLYMVPFHPDGVDSGQDPAPRFAVILSDITRDKQTTEERIESERTSSILLLAASVAHELGNPLNSLTIHLQLIERKLRKAAATAADTAAVQGSGFRVQSSRKRRASADNSKPETPNSKPAASAAAAGVAESIRICQEEVARLDGIITHFLEAIRPRPPDLAETDLMEVLGEVLHFQQRELEDRDIVIDAEMAPGVPCVMADRDQLKQVFFNVIKNAVQAMKPGGRLRIKSRADDDYVYLLFGDSGSGIRQKDLAQLFQPYHTTKADGTGLGLMIAQRIMREHGGQIGIESREHVGTVVTLQFPRKERRVRLLE